MPHVCGADSAVVLWTRNATDTGAFDAATENFMIGIGGRLVMLQPVPDSGGLSPRRLYPISAVCPIPRA